MAAALTIENIVLVGTVAQVKAALVEFLDTGVTTIENCRVILLGQPLEAQAVHESIVK
jgi:hypothetical protein